MYAHPYISCKQPKTTWVRSYTCSTTAHKTICRVHALLYYSTPRYRSWRNGRAYLAYLLLLFRGLLALGDLKVKMLQHLSAKIEKQ